MQNRVIAVLVIQFRTRIKGNDLDACIVEPDGTRENVQPVRRGGRDPHCVRAIGAEIEDAARFYLDGFRDRGGSVIAAECQRVVRARELDTANKAGSLPHDERVVVAFEQDGVAAIHAPLVGEYGIVARAQCIASLADG